MAHWIDKIPNQLGLHILDWIYANPGGTPQEYYEKTKLPGRPSLKRTAWRFAQLERLGFLELNRKSDYCHYTAAMSREEFDGRCMKVIAENVFGGDLERLAAAVKWVKGKRK